MTYCCQDMKSHANHTCDLHSDASQSPDALIVHVPESGELGIRIHDGGSSFVEIRYCPWCGAGLTPGEPGNVVTISMTTDEALVLDDLLSEYGEHDSGRQLAVRRAAERNALWALSAALEKRLVAPFESDYSAQLAAARARLEERGGSWE